MKKKTLFLSSVLAMAVVGGLIFGGIHSQASTTAEQEAKYTVTKYFDAVMTGDAENMIKYTKDLRYPDDTEKREKYLRFASEKGVEKVDILSFKEVDESNMIVTIRFKSKFSGTHELDIPVVKENNEWKVVIEGKVLPKNDK